MCIAKLTTKARQCSHNSRCNKLPPPAAVRQTGDRQTRRVLGMRAHLHVPPKKVFPRLAVNKTILKPRLAAATGAQYLYVGFSRRNQIPSCSAYDIVGTRKQSAHSDYNPQTLITRHATFHPNPCSRF